MNVSKRNTKIQNIYADYIERDRSIHDIEIKYHKSRKGLVCDNIISFDIETTSGFMNEIGDIEGYSYINDEKYYKRLTKVGLCYIWQVAIESGEEDWIYYGRTLESFAVFLSDIQSLMKPDTKIIVWSHNLSFEFHWLRNVLYDMQVFARKVRKPIYATWDKFEFRCSYMLTRLGIADWAKGEKLYHQKLKGNLDYTLIRTPYTILWEDELEYCFEDVLVPNEGLRKYRDRFGSVDNIPLTQTGIVRREFADIMKNERNYQFKMLRLLPDTLSEYNELVHVFSGGITRADRFYVGQIVDEVMSRDASSAYPWQMIDKKYPMTKFIATEYSERYMETDDYSYIIEVEFYNIESKLWNCYLSASKCTDYINETLDNGRIVSADYVRIKTINIDYELIKASYNIERENIISFKYSVNGYLPKIFCIHLLELYANKTKLKDVEGMESMYMKAKEGINGAYGDFVTRIYSSDAILEDNNWKINELTEVSFLDKVAKSKRNLRKFYKTYSQGVFVPAYQRQSLWSHLLNCEGLDMDTIYMDTDSNKHRNHFKYDAYFEEYNQKIRDRQEYHANRLGVDLSMFRPVSPKGKVCSLGEYPVEEIYRHFVTLGAKRYAYETQDGELHITVSGVSKKAVKQLNSIHDFTDGFYFDEHHAGKMIMHYIENQPICTFNRGMYDEFTSEYLYAICAQPTGYHMELTKEYRDIVRDSISALADMATLNKLSRGDEKNG